MSEYNAFDKQYKDPRAGSGGACGTSPARGLLGSDADLQMQCAQECAKVPYRQPQIVYELRERQNVLRLRLNEVQQRLALVTELLRVFED